MNSHLAQDSNFIMFRPQLREYFGDSLYATILAPKLEYWFHVVNKKQTDIDTKLFDENKKIEFHSKTCAVYYKFSTPCNHPQYRVGDSWIEETGLNKYELRKGFDVLRTHYKSIAIFNEALTRAEQTADIYILSAEKYTQLACTSDFSPFKVKNSYIFLIGENKIMWLDHHKKMPLSIKIKTFVNGDTIQKIIQIIDAIGYDDKQIFSLREQGVDDAIILELVKAITVITHQRCPIVFNGKYYLSYVDVKNNMTYYLRNDVLMDGLLNEVVKNKTPQDKEGNNLSPPRITLPLSSNQIATDAVLCAQSTEKHSQLIDYTGDVNFKSPEVQNLHPQDFKFSTPRDVNFTSPLKETKNTKEYDQRLAAATPAQSIAAAALFINFSDQDYVVGRALTTKQVAAIQTVVQDLCRANTALVPEVLTEEIHFVLLSEKAFKQAGVDFVKKLNTIKKMIGEGRWSRPAELCVAAINEKVQTENQAEKTRQELLADRAHWQQMLKLTHAVGRDETRSRQINEILAGINGKLQLLQTTSGVDLTTTMRGG